MSSRLEPVLLAICSAMFFACGDDTVDPALDGSLDGGALDGEVPTADLPAPPNIPWLDDGAPAVAAPALTPCPEGWREVPVDGAPSVSICDPYPAGGMESCDDGEAHFPGEPGCRTVGAPCPTSRFPADLPSTGNVVFVDPSASSGGDGSRASPYRTLAEVVAAAIPSGSTIALSKGRHPRIGRVPLPPGATVVGACAAQTIVEGQLGSAGGPPVTIQDLTIATVAADVTAEVVLSGVVVAGGGDRGVVSLGTMRLTDVVIEDTSGASDMSLGAGVIAADGGTVDAERVIVQRTRHSGVLAFGGSVTLRDVAVVDTLEEASTRMVGAGLSVVNGASATVSRFFAAGNKTAGVLVDGGESRLSLSDAVLRDATPAEAGEPFAPGLAALDGATVEAERLTISDNAGVGVLGVRDSTISVRDAVVTGQYVDETAASMGSVGQGLAANLGTSLSATRVLAADNHHTGVAVAAGTVTLEDARLLGGGLSVFRGGTATVDRLVVEDAPLYGIVVSEPGSRVDARDVLVDRSQPDADGLWGHGASIYPGATLSLKTAVVRSSRDMGILATGADVMVELDDVVVHDVEPEVATGTFGRGLELSEGAALVANRMEVVRATDVGIIVSGDSQAELHDVAIRETRPTREGESGRGLHAQADCVIQADRLLIADAFDVGAYFSLGARGDLANLTITGLRSKPCAAEGTCVGRGGHALAVAAASVAATGFLLDDSATCGLFLAEEPTLDITEGVVQGASIGACVQVSDYDLSRLMGDVVYRDNESNLDTTSLPVPELPMPGERAAPE